MFKGVSGIPCPGCGMGRSTWKLLRGDVLASLYYHPFGIVFNGFLLLALFWSLRDMIYGEASLWKALKRPWPKIYVIILLVLILVAWGRSIIVGI
ncbi:DUF2752 domain-containing protein [Carboxylicivirga sp. N1Y90]|uniref:DUF2752 domain-containing protein n=1 Tax=Carboxylicivirga fragile TaxID=3417571 RepID=UPI003D336FE6|nr:DUF2752 domain-containing protein [Marinilabiliaceae bacterium N1Y90]